MLKCGRTKRLRNGFSDLTQLGTNKSGFKEDQKQWIDKNDKYFLEQSRCQLEDNNKYVIDQTRNMINKNWPET